MAREVTFKLNLKIDGKDVVRQLTVDVDELQRAIGESKTKVDQFTASLIKLNQTSEFAENISKSISQVANVLGNLTSESRGFSGAMAAANTMAGKSGEEFANLKSQVADLAKEVPVARDELANGLYQVISNGVPEGNWLEYLQTSAESSVGGIADLSEVVKVTSTVIKNYGLEWSDAGAIQDKIQLTAKNGVTSFEQMAQALPRVTANAATLGVSIDELMASFATLTGVSGDTAEVSTQLAAIFTALIKPSSEATEMAQQMGIQFDAAAIKAAGGMQQFLVSLNDSVRQFSVSSGMLEQEIYGKLFGSAESLRAITPLVGNLSDTFQRNVEGMAESAGTVKNAFGTMGSTGAAQLQLLQNKLAAFSDFATTVFGPILPTLNITAQVSLTAASIISLCNGMGKLGLVTKATSFLMQAFGPIVQVCSATMRGAAVSATTLKLAIKGLMISTGVGIAVVALTSAIEALMSTEDDATEKSAEMEEAEQAFQSTAANTKVSIDNETRALGNLIKKKEDTTEAVKHLNDTYGEVFGNHKTAAEWYDILTKKSQIYARQLGYEAQLKILSTRLAEKQIQLQDNYDKRRDLWNSGGARQTTTRTVGVSSSGAAQTVTYQEDTPEYTNLKNQARGLIPEIEAIQRQVDIATSKMAECAQQIKNVGTASSQAIPIAKMNAKQLGDEIDKLKAKLQVAAGSDNKEATRLDALIKTAEARKKSLEDKYSSLSTGKSKNKTTQKEPKFYKNPTTSEQLDRNINYYQGKLTEKNTAEDQRLRKQIQLWKDKKAAIDLANLAASRPEKLNSVDAYEKDISALQQMVNLSIDPNEAKKLQQQLEAETRELGMLKIKIGIESVPKIEVEKKAKGIFQKIDEQMADFLKKYQGRPIVLDVTAKEQDINRIKELANIDLSNFESVRNAFANIQGIVDPTAKGFAAAGASCEALGSAMQQLGSDSAAGKAGMIMAAIGQIVLSFAQALRSCTNWVEWLAFGISGTAQMISIIATVSKFATGGIVGGNQKSGDNVLVRVNSGEMILNAAQQARLFAIADGTAAYGASSQIASHFAQGVALPSVSVQTDRLQGIMADGGGNQAKAVEWRLRGRDIVASIANETRSNRKRSNIRLK